MKDLLLQYINIIDSEYIQLFIISMAPITELRFSIPYGILIKNLNIYNVVFVSVLGNIIIGILIIYIIAPTMEAVRKINYFDKIINFIFKRTLNKSKVIERIKFWGLVIFIGIPFPLTGVWTGSLASYLLRIPKKISITAIILGVLISSSIVTFISVLSIK